MCDFSDNRANRSDALGPFAGFQSVALQTRCGQLFVKVEPGIEDDDFILLDKSGHRYSYKHFFVNNIIEDIVLKGKT
jgi:hypothetical protein